MQLQQTSVTCNARAPLIARADGIPRRKQTPRKKSFLTEGTVSFEWRDALPLTSVRRNRRSARGGVVS